MKTLKVSPAILRPVWQETLKVLETFRVCDVLGWIAPCGDAAGASAPCGDDSALRAAHTLTGAGAETEKELRLWTLMPSVLDRAFKGEL